MQSLDGTALLTDTGSPGSRGDIFSRLQSEQPVIYGRLVGNICSMDHPSLVGGVGNGAQATDCRVTMRSGVEDTRGDRFDGTYVSPALPDSRCPGLVGRRTIKDDRMLLDTYKNKAYMIGLGGYRVHLSTGSKVLNSVDSSAGQLMPPCSVLASFAVLGS